jgi:ribosome-binding protein aMBF1 (putative translation factor)
MASYSLAQRIRVARAYKGWSQTELAKRAGVHHVMISKLGIGQKYAPDFMRIRERRGNSTWASDRQKGFSCFV